MEKNIIKITRLNGVSSKNFKIQYKKEILFLHP
jgi:hypothetical protein